MTKAIEELERVKKLAQNIKPESFPEVMTRVMGKEYVPATEETPYDVVVKRVELPYPAYEFQQETINDLAPSFRVGLYYEQGTGKTLTATVMAIFKMVVGLADKALVIMPPILLDQWQTFLEKIPGTTVTVYRGTPATRKKIKLAQTQFTLVGLQIFKLDYDRFCQAFDADTVVILDEAHSIKNVSSDNHKKYRRFVADKAHMLLTGTPISTPEDGFAYVKLIAPDVYRNKTQFMNVHAGERDFFNKVVSWKNLELLEENMKISAHRVLKEDVLKDLPPITYTPLFYQLEAPHAQLYKKLAEEQLLLLEDGSGKIDATSSGALFHALGQIICNYDHFSGDPSKRATCFTLLDQLMDELGDDSKLMVFATYRMTNRALLKYMAKYGAVAAFGDQTTTQNMASVERFKVDPKCRVFIAQPTTAGVGIDEIQYVCRDGIFLEIPSVRDFQQAVSRLHRAGQRNGVHIRIATAQGTLQVRQQQNLLDRDSLINKVIRNVQDLREAIYGSGD